VRPALRLPLAVALAAVLATPAAEATAATSTTGQLTATTAAPSATTTPQPAPGSAFGPLQPLSSGPDTSTQTVTAAKRPDNSGLDRSTLLLLSAVSLLLIVGVVGLIWFEGRRMGATRKRRRRMRSGRTPAPAGAGTSARRGPPPPPRKRRAQAKRKKR
jgi:hypothetical protein